MKCLEHVISWEHHFLIISISTESPVAISIYVDLQICTIFTGGPCNNVILHRLKILHYLVHILYLNIFHCSLLHLQIKINTRYVG